MPSWEGIWAAGLSKGQCFDAARVEPAFARLLQSGAGLPKGGLALVPGCGRGYAVAALAQAGFQAVGLEIAPSAVAAASAHLEAEGLPPGSWRVEAGDFFARGERQFDLIYDCTFLCALQPDQRQDWAAQMDALLAPQGELVTLIFPVKDQPDAAGPPFHVSPELLKGLLEPRGLRPTLLEEVPRELMARAAFPAKEWIARWSRAPARPEAGAQAGDGGEGSGEAAP